jgi:hypothetical protein
MAKSGAAALDKTYTAEVEDNYGNMKIRVVVLRKKDEAPTGDDPPLPFEALDDDVEDTGKRPIDPFLESPKRGKECCVFLVNGQRQDAWDDVFIVRDLNLKYLRQRMIVVVDLDDLKPEAISELMQGSRQAFYQGNVYGAISRKLIKTLRKDPDLEKIQEDAQQSLLEMKTADEAVKNKLDKLIDGFHAAAAATGPGGGAPEGTTTSAGPLFGNNTTTGDVVTVAAPGTGLAADRPVIIPDPPTASVRLTPNTSLTFCIVADPSGEWANIQDFTARLEPEVNGLALAIEQCTDGAKLTVIFTEPEDIDEDEYPFDSTITAFAKFAGKDTPRMLQVPVVIVRPRKVGKRKPRVLRPEPTYLRVATRQPIPLVSGGPTKHVRLIWDGEDSLVVGDPAAWVFSARCISLDSFPTPGISHSGGGRVDVLVDTPHGFIAGAILNFEVRAAGPEGRTFVVPFVGHVFDPNATNPGATPQLVTANAPNPAGQRRPPYKVVPIKEEQWKEQECWAGGDWTAADVGCFIDPTDTAPLILVLNEDFGPIRAFCDDMVKRNLAESYIEAQKTKYYSTVAYHLYLMYRSYRVQMDASSAGKADPPKLEDLRNEINRVGTSLVTMI